MRIEVGNETWSWFQDGCYLKFEDPDGVYAFTINTCISPSKEYLHACIHAYGQGVRAGAQTGVARLQTQLCELLGVRTSSTINT